MRHLLLLDDEAHVLQALQRELRQNFAADGLKIDTFTYP